MKKKVQDPARSFGIGILLLTIVSLSGLMLFYMAHKRQK